MTTGKAYEVKDWFANKVANELERNISMCEVFAILKETDKAVYAMLNCGCRIKKTMWVPKSVLVELEAGMDEATQKMHYETIITDDYEEASDLFNKHWNMYE